MAAHADEVQEKLIFTVRCSGEKDYFDACVEHGFIGVGYASSLWITDTTKLRDRPDSPRWYPTNSPVDPDIDDRARRAEQIMRGLTENLGQERERWKPDRQEAIAYIKPRLKSKGNKDRKRIGELITNGGDSDIVAEAKKMREDHDNETSKQSALFSMFHDGDVVVLIGRGYVPGSKKPLLAGIGIVDSTTTVNQDAILAALESSGAKTHGLCKVRWIGKGHAESLALLEETERMQVYNAQNKTLLAHRPGARTKSESPDKLLSRRNRDKTAVTTRRNNTETGKPQADTSPAEILFRVKNIILEGVPGTGKTFRLGGLSGTLRERWTADTRNPHRLVHPPGDEHFDSITFHPATSYEDFVEGIRPLNSSSERDRSNRTLDIRNKLDNVPLRLEKNKEPVFEAIGPDAPMFVETPSWFFQHAFTQTEGWGVRDGFFLQVCQRALLKPNHAFVVLLDELNRANVPKVMGDLLTTLERSKRALWTGSAWNLDKATVVKLPVSGRKFFVPENIFVVGTMNTSDRSVTPLDAALRRRFAFYRLEPNRGEELKEALGAAYRNFDRKEPSWKKTLEAYEALQDWLSAHLGPDGMLGHSYLFDLLGDLERDGVSDAAEIESYHQRTWRYVILPQVTTAIESAGQEDLIPAKGEDGSNDKVSKLDEATMKWGSKLRRSAHQSFLGSIVIDG